MGPKKHLGQHFLTAPAFAKRIALAVPASVGEHVLEIGPGHGALSTHLKEHFPDFHLVEVDQDAILRLREKLGEGQYAIHHSDILRFDYAEAGFPLHVVGNLPYNIGALIIKKTLLYSPGVLSCTFMVQREVAQRIVSGPHCKTNGFLSVFCQFFGNARILFHVPPGAFFPRPNVESSVFQILVDKDVESRLSSECWEAFFAFVDRGFSMRRKQLAKILAMNGDLPKEHYGVLLKDMGLKETSRPEDLDVDRWLELFRKVHPS
ncbi:MAG: 16S rRNA (adenine(1518)-N(6)/adenine(1519)-N(6))-dimethyltransferase RsmA [Chitinispirillaceae bacterium]